MSEPEVGLPEVTDSNGANAGQIYAVVFAVGIVCSLGDAPKPRLSDAESSDSGASAMKPKGTREMVAVEEMSDHQLCTTLTLISAEMDKRLHGDR